MADLRVDLGRIQLKNPVMTASGTFGYGAEYEEFFPVSELGAVVVKGVAPWQSHGNPTPRVAEVTSGMLNAIGLQGPGIDRFLHDEHYMPFLRKSGATTIVNIWGKRLRTTAKSRAALTKIPKGSPHWKSMFPVRMSRKAASHSEPIRK